MDKQNQLLRLFKLIQQIDINNKLEDGKFIFKQQTRKVIKNEIDRLSTIAQQSLSGSDDKSSSPKSCANCAEYKWCDGFSSACYENNYKYYKKRT